MDNTVFVILGRKGSGKSYLSSQIIEEYDRVIVLDSLGEYEGTVTDGLEETVRTILAVKDKPRFRIVARILAAEDAEKIMRLVYEIPNCLFVIEETSLYCSPSYLPDDLARLIRYGRHREISLLFVSRRPSELHRDLTAQADLVVTFQQQEPRDITYLGQIFGRDVAASTVNLDRYQFVLMGDRSKAPLVLLAREKRGARQLTLLGGSDSLDN